MKVKYNVEGVESGGDFEPVKPGLYRAKIKEINDWSADHGAGMEVVLTVTGDAQGRKKDVEGIGSQLWTYIYFDYEPTAFKFAEFLEATGVAEKDSKKGRKGTLDTNKLIGTELQVKVKSDRNLDGDYRPKVGKLLALDGASEPEEPEEEEEEGEAVDLDTLDRAELKALIKDEDLDIKVLKSKSDDDLRKEIADALGREEESDDEEEEEEEEDDDVVDLDELDRSELKAHVKENELDVRVLKSDSDDDIREKIRALGGEADEEEEEDDDAGEAKPDYDTWTIEQLRAEIKNRGVSTKASSKKALAQRLRKDDEDDSEPF